MKPQNKPTLSLSLSVVLVAAITAPKLAALGSSHYISLLSLPPWHITTPFPASPITSSSSSLPQVIIFPLAFKYKFIILYTYVNLICLSSVTISHFSSYAVGATTFTFVNRCHYTVWPGILPNAGTGTLGTTGFDLPQDTSRSFLAPTGWSGRFWARTGCNFDGGSSTCLTGDCNSGQIQCNGAGATPPVTLAEFTLSSATGGQDFYDVSLVDGYNVPMTIENSGGSGLCGSTGCVSDLNLNCPAELRVGDGGACKSACMAFNKPEYCCSGTYGSPATCKPSVYSEMFKSACPRSYSYAYDDASSTFTCTGGDYTVTFCPSSPR